MEAQALGLENGFLGAVEQFTSIVKKLGAPAMRAADLSDVEMMLADEGRELMRRFIEEHANARCDDFGPRLEGTDRVVRDQRRTRDVSVQTIFGAITVSRTLYGKVGADSLAPKDAVLNLPAGRHFSHGLQNMLACEVVRGSFDDAIAAVAERTGVTIHKRQAGEVACAVAADFDAFYAARANSQPAPPTTASDPTTPKPLLVASTDGKGVVMRHEGLRDATRAKAEKNARKLATRLSPGEKSCSKRMAQVASVYDIGRHERTVDQIVEGEKAEKPPKPENKRVWASVAKEQCEVIGAMMDEVQRRDPARERELVILVDGGVNQLEIIHAELRERKIAATIVLDIVHVLEYLWHAAYCFHAVGTKEAEAWVKRYFRMILEGKAQLVAAAMRRSATRQKLTERKAVDKCAGYLLNNALFMQYEYFLARGMPIATGVIEGACRYVVKDRMDLTGARWGLAGAEAVLKLRSIRASGDWEAYRVFHERSEYERNHRSRYAHPQRIERRALRVVK